MELESKVFFLQRRLSVVDADFSELPGEFRVPTQRYMRMPAGVADRMLTLAALCFTAAVLLPFFGTPFSQTATMKAVPLQGTDGLGFVTFLGEVEDLSPTKNKDMFGWGGLDLVYRASQALAPHLQNCRAQLQVTRAKMGLTFRFDVKVDVNKPGFNVTGLLDGQDTEPEVASCLRDKINTMQITDFSTLRAAPPKSYKLRLAVQLAHGSDGGAP